VVDLTYGLPPRTAQAIIVTVLLFLHLVDIVSRAARTYTVVLSSRTGLDALRECLKPQEELDGLSLRTCTSTALGT